MTRNSDIGSASHTLRVLRVAQQKTQDELALAAGVSRETICRVERGYAPSARTARKLANAIGCDVAILIPREDADG